MAERSFSQTGEENNNVGRNGGGDYAQFIKGQKNSWTSELEEELHDSGHFTSSEVEHGSESPESHSQILESTGKQLPKSSAMVLNALRRGEEDIVNESKSKLPHTYAYTASYQSSQRGMGETMESISQSSLERHSCAVPSVCYLRAATENFNSLYQEKLKIMEDYCLQGDGADKLDKLALMERKVNILESWVKDVVVQNMVLIETVEELEKQGEEKLQQLQFKINESTMLADKYKIMIGSYHCHIHEKQLALESMKDTANLYKSQYETVEEKLGHKDKIIEELQNTVNQLNNKQRQYGIDASTNTSMLQTCLHSTLIEDCDRNVSNSLQNHNFFIKAPRTCFEEIQKLPLSEHATKPATIISKASPQICPNNSNRFNLATLKHSTGSFLHKNDSVEKSGYSLCSCGSHEYDAEIGGRSAYSFQNKLPALKRSDQFPLSKSKQKVMKPKPILVDAAHVLQTPKNSTQCYVKKSSKHCKNRKTNLSDESYLNMLMGVALKACHDIRSSELKDSHVSSIRVVAGRRLHRDKSRTRSKLLFDSEDILQSDVKHDKSSYPTKNVETLLSELPCQSSINGIREWVKRSNTKISQTSHSSCVGKNDAIVEKALARVSSAKIAMESSSKVFEERAMKLESEIAGIKEEWNRIFSNGDPATETFEMESDGDLSGCESTNGYTIAGNFVMPEQNTTDTTKSAKLYNNNESTTTSQLDATEIEKLQLENAKLTQERKRTEELLNDKEVEITMQKLTIQHLQTSIVAMKKGQPIPSIANNSNSSHNGPKILEI